ncbi:MAG: hypothetical protein KC502_16365 [Myxococcales bacterium]|nr:hypothetical protein [Myxococcales bacterium]
MARFRPHRMYPGALLAQECCSYQANTQLLAKMRGDLMVLVHSDRDCSNVIGKRASHVHAHHDYKFLCTNMREDEMVTGQGNRRLREAIGVIAETYAPRLLIVLSTCPTVMIGDNIKNVTRKTARKLGIDAVAQLTHGLKPKSPAEVVDDLYCTLTKAAKVPEGDRSHTVNLVGMGLRTDERMEITAVLEAMGIAVGVVLDDHADLDEFLAVGAAGFNVHPGPNMLLSFDKACAERLGQVAVEVPLPYGVAATEAFYRRIGAAVGVPETRVEAAISGRLRKARASLTQVQARFAGRKPALAYNIGSVRSFDLRRVAHEELGELGFFREMGFDTRLFIQTSQSEANWDRVAKVLGELGVTERFILFPDPGALAHFLKPGQFDIWYGARFLRDQLEQVQLALLPHQELGLGFDAVTRNIAIVEATLDSKFYERFEANVQSTGGVEQLDEMIGLGKGIPVPPTRDEADA